MSQNENQEQNPFGNSGDAPKKSKSAPEEIPGAEITKQIRP